MKQINSWMYFLITFACAAVLSACAGDGIEESSFESKVYLNSEKEETLLIKPGEPSYTKTLQTALPKALDHDITVKFAADLSKVDEYNTYIKTMPCHCQKHNINSPLPKLSFRLERYVVHKR